jgi:hypothetical protein
MAYCRVTKIASKSILVRVDPVPEQSTQAVVEFEPAVELLLPT